MTVGLVLDPKVLGELPPSPQPPEDEWTPLDQQQLNKLITRRKAFEAKATERLKELSGAMDDVAPRFRLEWLMSNATALRDALAPFDVRTL